MYIYINILRQATNDGKSSRFLSGFDNPDGTDIGYSGWSRSTTELAGTTTVNHQSTLFPWLFRDNVNSRQNHPQHSSIPQSTTRTSNSHIPTKRQHIQRSPDSEEDLYGSIFVDEEDSRHSKRQKPTISNH